MTNLKADVKKLKDHKHMPQYHRIALWNLKKISNNANINRSVKQCYYHFENLTLQEVCQPQVVIDLCNSINHRSCLNWKTRNIKV